jgi:hypothetical protein
MTLKYGATATHSEYVLLITFTRQQWLIRGYSHTLRICIIIITFTRQRWLTRSYSHTQNMYCYYFYTATMVNTELQPHSEYVLLLLLHGNNG